MIVAGSPDGVRQRQRQRHPLRWNWTWVSPRLLLPPGIRALKDGTHGLFGTGHKRSMLRHRVSPFSFGIGVALMQRCSVRGHVQEEGERPT